MRWQGRRQSDNVEDRRNQRISASEMGIRTGLAGIGFGLLRSGGKGFLILALIFIGLSYFGFDSLRFLFGDGVLQQTSSRIETQSPEPVNDTRKQFVSSVLAETEDAWSDIFRKKGMQYTAPGLVLFRTAVRSACGTTTSAVGPFYCPNDRKIYLDETFFDQLAKQLGAPGEFAQAYVIAHEVGHHIQNLTGILGAVERQRQMADEREANAITVRIELQADCFAGLWAHYTEKQGILETGDIGAAVNATRKIGDDALQRRAQGYVVPDSFTHGTSQQRAYWFQRGYEKGTIEACNTMSGDI